MNFRNFHFQLWQIAQSLGVTNPARPWGFQSAKEILEKIKKRVDRGYHTYLDSATKVTTTLNLNGTVNVPAGVKGIEYVSSANADGQNLSVGTTSIDVPANGRFFFKGDQMYEGVWGLTGVAGNGTFTYWT